MVKKKLIGFDEAQTKKIEEYSKKWKLDKSKTVRKMVDEYSDVITDEQEEYLHEDVSLKTHFKIENSIIQNQIDELKKDHKELKKNYSYFQADETQSKVGNVEAIIEDFEKKLNILTKVSKLFKGHIRNREIHLQD